MKFSKLGESNTVKLSKWPEMIVQLQSHGFTRQFGSSHYTFSEAKFTGPVIPPVTYDISKLPRVANIGPIGTVTGTKY